MTSEAFNYSGNELDVFSLAANWKAYWAAEIGGAVGDKVLEVGAGIGSTAKALAGLKRYARWTALEPDKNLCAVISADVADHRYPDGFELICGSTEDFDCEDCFDTALYIDVLEHIEDDAAELLRVRDKLLVGGKIIIVAPAHNFLFTPFDKKIGHYRRYDRSMLQGIVPDGLRVVRLKYLDSVGMCASLANRLLLRSDSPSQAQVQLWDKYMVTASRIVDPLFAFRLGKSIVCITERTA